MIVTEQDARRIIGGRKTSHRMPWRSVAPAKGAKVNVQVRRPNAGLGYIDGVPRLELVTICRVTVVNVSEDLFAAMTLLDANEEGFKTKEDFFEAWEARWGKINNETRCWVVDFELDRECKPRYLSAGVIAGAQGDYVNDPHRALADEPEAVDEFTQARITRLARETDSLRTKRTREQMAEMPLEDYFHVLRSEAKKRNVDIRPNLRQIARYGDKVMLAQVRGIAQRLGWPAPRTAA